MEPARKQEVINVCLETFMKKGLAHTSTKDLCAALNLNTGGVFYYFKTKDEIVIACAEEASLRIERDLVGVALKDIENPFSYVMANGSLTLNDPERHGYTFGGWYIKEDFTDDKVTSLSTTYPKPVTLYAKWIPKKVKLGCSGERRGAFFHKLQRQPDIRGRYG